MMRRLEIELAEVPRRFESPRGLGFRPTERLVRVLCQMALVALELLKLADLDHGQIEAGLPQGFQLLPHGLNRPLVRDSQFVMDRQAQGSSPLYNKYTQE